MSDDREPSFEIILRPVVQLTLDPFSIGFLFGVLAACHSSLRSRVEEWVQQGISLPMIFEEYEIGEMLKCVAAREDAPAALARLLTRADMDLAAKRKELRR